MEWKTHSEVKGKHALFSPSQSAWLRYGDDKIADRVRNKYRTTLGTELHEYAASQIELGHKATSARSVEVGAENYIYAKHKFLSDKGEVSSYGLELLRHLGYLPKEVFETVRLYINDAIGYRMNVEQPLVYSENIFGTADAICFRKGLLRIHDLKTGAQPAHMEQLEAYAALFCLEYGVTPSEIAMELRLYQWDGVVVHEPTLEDIVPVIDRIISTERIASESSVEG